MPFGEKMAVAIPSEVVVVIFYSKRGASVRCAKFVALSGCVPLGDRAVTRKTYVVNPPTGTFANVYVMRCSGRCSDRCSDRCS